MLCQIIVYINLNKSEEPKYLKMQRAQSFLEPNQKPTVAEHTPKTNKRTNAWRPALYNVYYTSTYKVWICCMSRETGSMSGGHGPSDLQIGPSKCTDKDERLAGRASRPSDPISNPNSYLQRQTSSPPN